MFDWATFVVTDSHRNKVLLRDCATAYLFSLEATLQVLLREKAFPNFDGWLRTNASYDVTIRGLRTLRHLQAHIEPRTLTARREPTVSRFANVAIGGTVAWCWADITLAQLASVTAKNAKLAIDELPTWNRYCQTVPILAQMRHGVKALHECLWAAGP